MIEKQYDRLSFEEIVELKLEYLKSLPDTIETRTAIANLKWVLDVYQEKMYRKYVVQKSNKDYVKRRK